ncbi:hypothetical protein A33Q_3759 [Indibacter alkaliphilus LW1]|jgi:hypothetical protein|uniref:Uncharacterized protein n=1 Tax=Indibacter alkaliphilus (strain CCUG 57479 / KCTC 22604 / LW1) TaxID=1189612 RepID=S2D8Z2_INDAL|nr:hypothetical protein [Indibacter alkaliphilus]EOZ93500.1 hypothetical protein A33Q_3759 [Indibacter alkaliphilus LW1]
MNKFFIIFAALVSSGIFAYSYLKEWIGIKLGRNEIILQTGENLAPYFHSSEELYLRVVLIFGLVFSCIFLATIYYTVKKKEKMVMLCFVLSMLSIFALMINGAIK